MKEDFEYIDDFKFANDMAKMIKQYNQNYFIVVISQYSWEK